MKLSATAKEVVADAQVEVSQDEPAEACATTQDDRTILKPGPNGACRTPPTRFRASSEQGRSEEVASPMA